MSSQDLATRFIDEICSRVPELEMRRQALILAFESLAEHRYQVACRYDSAVSMTVHGEQRIVFVSVVNGTGGDSVLWDLLHELGHVISGDPHMPSGISESVVSTEGKRREIEAWDNAQSYLEEHLLALWETEQESFNHRRVFCLKTYGVG